MAPVLFPTNPSQLMAIRNITPDIITMSLPFARFGHLKFGARGTLGLYSFTIMLTNIIYVLTIQQSG